MPQYQAAQRISVYLSMPSGEILTTGIIHDAFQRGKEVFVPFIYRLAEPQAGQPKSIIDMLKLSSVQEFEGLQSDAWGIPSLDEETIPQRPNSFGWAGKSEGRIVNDDDDESRKRGLDLVVVPGQAFDASFGRLGHGKGFYDLFFERTRRQADLRSSKMPFLGMRRKAQVESHHFSLMSSSWPVPGGAVPRQLGHSNERGRLAARRANCGKRSSLESREIVEQNSFPLVPLPTH